MPFRFLVLLTALLHVYIGLRVLPMIDATSRLAASVVLVALLMSVVTMPLPFLARRDDQGIERTAFGPERAV